ncbi:Asp-tRNA(Asn)/Glu-tRNA(Gln) amidotransferase subunit GatC [Candidatus Parcubacteria bacterium]|nr:Asp-tRNA(Asn)/Glu-tRNA(Gln) amidotransferase subunit GatC [Patescibacteria group bacterium]MBU4482044.1 Asp-tRNA(Asn)/Glu-tRNA(Gln) amidotransferase subunit GatC [Patescibacteria group bacterium]MCG2687016.1 Asp-tRNA(Asn)/Glu-tRNA(Gln) amidotransferase subunit GatC [Candidatus Parcubacteria bacterium]
MISKQEVQHIAKLARLDLSELEIKKYQDQLGEILDYVEKLQEVDTNGVETADGGTMDLENVWRDDSQQLTVNSQQLTKNLINMAPDVENGLVKVKKIL